MDGEPDSISLDRHPCLADRDAGHRVNTGNFTPSRIVECQPGYRAENPVMVRHRVVKLILVSPSFACDCSIAATFSDEMLWRCRLCGIYCSWFHRRQPNINTSAPKSMAGAIFATGHFVRIWAREFASTDTARQLQPEIISVDVARASPTAKIWNTVSVMNALWVL